jgi:archaellum component FlaC
LHAAEKFDGMLEKVRECSEGVEKIKDTVKDIVTRFEEIRTRRLALFNVWFPNSYLKASWFVI